MECFDKLRVALENIDFEVKDGPKLKPVRDIDTERLVYAVGLPKGEIQAHVESLREHVSHCSPCIEVYVEHVKTNQNGRSFSETEARYLNVLGRD